MTIRPAQGQDIPALLRLLSQVLELHAGIRPDIFRPGTTKYTHADLSGMLDNPDAPIYVAADEADRVLGYAFCVLQRPAPSNNLVPVSALYLDDLCVDTAARGRGVGKALFQYVKAQAAALGCRELLLNVWEGNDRARAFYERMGMGVRKTTMELRLTEGGSGHGA